MTSHRKVAWVPTSKPGLVRAVAVWVSPGQTPPIDLPSLLADRIQELIEMSDEPEETAAELVQKLYNGNLWPYEASVPVSEAANLLIWSNPAIAEQLSSFGVSVELREFSIHEMSEVRELLESEREDPYSSVMSWADAISRPWWQYADNSADIDDTEAPEVSQWPAEVPGEALPHGNLNSTMFSEGAYVEARARLRKFFGEPEK